MEYFSFVAIIPPAHNGFTLSVYRERFPYNRVNGREGILPLHRSPPSFAVGIGKFSIMYVCEFPKYPGEVCHDHGCRMAMSAPQSTISPRTTIGPTFPHYNYRDDDSEARCKCVGGMV